jgi:hypothetical protein
VLKALKKEFCCNGTVVDDPELGKVIQLQGDQRKNVSDFLLGQKLVKKDQIKVRHSAGQAAWQGRLCSVVALSQCSPCWPPRV